MTKEELLKLVEIEEILQKIFDGKSTEDDLKNLLGKLDGISSLNDLKKIIKDCLKKKFDSFDKFKECVLFKIKLKNKLRKKLK